VLCFLVMGQRLKICVFLIVGGSFCACADTIADYTMDFGEVPPGSAGVSRSGDVDSDFFNEA